jgi:uncharacterized sulfatase
VRETKFTLWDDGAQVVFFIADPRRPETAGTRCDRPVTLTDIFPTVATMAGVDLPDPRIRGYDLAPLLDDPQAAWRPPAHTTFRNVTYNQVTTDRFKLIRYGEGSDELELYDLQDDPEEFDNLAEDPDWAGTRADMLEILEQSLRAGHPLEIN